MTEIKKLQENLMIFHCDHCNDDFCANCNSKHNYLIWNLCQKCYYSKLLPLKEKYKKLRKRRQKRYTTFSMVFQKGNEFKILMKTFGTNYDDIQIIRNNTELKIVSIDSLKITLCTCKLPIALYFKDLERLPKKTNIQIEDLCTYLEYINESGPIKLLKKDSLINLITEKSKITIHTSEREGDYLEEIKTLKLEELNYDDEFVINPKKLLSILNICSKFSETFIIQSKVQKEKEGKIIFKTSGNNSFEEILEKKDLIESKLNNNFKVCFKTCFIKEFLETLFPIMEKLIISIKDDHPIKIHMILKKGGSISLFVAPRVIED